MPVNIEEIQNVYFAFRKSQADYKGRGFRMPKDFESHLEKMKEINRKRLIKITGFFLTKWSNIDPYTYFTCGFELYKSFSYYSFLNKKIIELYIRKDTNKKREVNITKKGLVDSAKFVKNYMADNDINSIEDYIRKSNGYHRLAVDHYMKNKIDSSFFVLLIRKGLILTDNERSLIPYISINFRKIVEELKEISSFVKELEKKI